MSSSFPSKRTEPSGSDDLKGQVALEIRIIVAFVLLIQTAGISKGE